MAPDTRSLDATHPFDPAVLEDPWDYYRRLRAEAPVYRDPHTGIFHVSSYALVLEAVRAVWPESLPLTARRCFSSSSSNPAPGNLSLAFSNATYARW